jgi:hypothetical protein
MDACARIVRLIIRRSNSVFDAQAAVAGLALTFPVVKHLHFGHIRTPS